MPKTRWVFLESGVSPRGQKGGKTGVSRGSRGVFGDAVDGESIDETRSGVHGSSVDKSQPGESASEDD